MIIHLSFILLLKFKYIMNLNNAQFDLNIANYKISELEQLLELPSNYDETIIENELIS